jgi:hypothetical protein
MVGVNMRIDDEMDTHAGGFRRAQIRLDRANRVDYGASGAAAAAEEVGDADRVLMEELTKDHGLVLLISMV